MGTAIKNIDVSGGVSGGTKPYTYSAKGLPAGIGMEMKRFASGSWIISNFQIVAV